VETEDDARILMGVARQAPWAAHHGAVRELQGNSVAGECLEELD